MSERVVAEIDSDGEVENAPDIEFSGVESEPSQAETPCAQLAATAIRCAGCPLLRFCPTAPESELQNTELELQTEENEPAELPTIVNPVQSSPQPVVSPVARPVEAAPKQPTPEQSPRSYLEQLMDDTVPVVMARSVEQHSAHEPAEKTLDIASPPPDVAPTPHIAPTLDIASEAPTTPDVAPVMASNSAPVVAEAPMHASSPDLNTPAEPEQDQPPALATPSASVIKHEFVLLEADSEEAAPVYAPEPEVLPGASLADEGVIIPELTSEVSTLELQPLVSASEPQLHESVTVEATADILDPPAELNVPTLVVSYETEIDAEAPGYTEWPPLASGMEPGLGQDLSVSIPSELPEPLPGDAPRSNEPLELTTPHHYEVPEQEATDTPGQVADELPLALATEEAPEQDTTLDIAPNVVVLERTDIAPPEPSAVQVQDSEESAPNVEAGDEWLPIIELSERSAPNVRNQSTTARSSSVSLSLRLARVVLGLIRTRQAVIYS